MHYRLFSCEIRQRRPYGVWILQRDQIVGTCYESGRKDFLEYRIWQQIEIDDMQFGFTKGKGATDAIFVARQMQENFRVKGKKLYFGFVDSEKAFEWILDLCNVIVKEGSIPEDWRSSVVLPIYKGKSGPMQCGSYRGIKLLEHVMKVVERIFK